MTPELYDSLDGQVVLLAGVDGGVGEAIAGELAEHGATLYAGSVDGTTPPGSIPLTLDVTDPESVGAAVGRVVAEQGGLDALVILPAVTDARDWNLLEVSIDAVDDTIARNLRGPLLLVRAALPYLLEHDGGRVVTVRPGVPGGPSPMGPAASVSAAALDAFTVYLDAAFAPRLVANSAAPGQARTDGGRSDPTEASAGTVQWLVRFRPGSGGGRVWRDRRAVDG